MNLDYNRLYLHRQDENKAVVIKEISKDEVTFLHTPLMNSDIPWLIPPSRETLSVEEFNTLYKPFKE